MPPLPGHQGEAPGPLSGHGDVRHPSPLEELLVRRQILAGVLGASGNDPGQLREVERAILLSLGVEEGSGAPLEGFLASVESLAASLPRGHDTPGRFGWEWVKVAGPDDLAPLFLGCRVVRAARRLAGFRDAVLVVTGVSRSLAEVGRQRLEARLADIRCDLEGLVARRAPFRTRLTLHIH